MKRILLIILIFANTGFGQSNSLAYKMDSQDKPNKNDSVAAELVQPLSLTYLQYETDYDPFRTEIDYTTLAGIGAVTLATGIAVHIYQKNAWWQDQRSSFHFTNDWEYALWIDKVGHFYGAALLAHLFSGGLEAANMNSEPAAIYGSLASFAFQMYVEIEDGFGPNWGFSPGDAVFDAAGSGFTLAQYYYPFLKNFQFKFSYFPSKKMREGLHKGNGIDDYEGQKYWLSFRVRNFLPENISKYWPSFLNVAAGMGVKDLNGNGGGQQEFYIALDLDVEELPLYGRVWQFVKNSFNYIHFPMPGIRVTPNATFFVFCY